MTDLYIRRSDARDIRRRAALIAAAGIAICVGGGYLLLRGCERSPNSLEQLSQQVAEDPLVDRLLAEPALPAESSTSTRRAENEVGLEEMVRDLGQWIEAEEDSRRTTSEKNRFNVATVLTIVGILVAIGLGIANLVLK